MSIFGWSYPAGCSGPPDDDDPFCAVCGGRVDLDQCVCPECPICGAVGDRYCYDFHALTRTSEQIRSYLVFRAFRIWEKIITENETDTYNKLISRFTSKYKKLDSEQKEILLRKMRDHG